MLTLGFWVGVVLAYWFWRKARQLKARGVEGFAYHLLRDSLDFLIPFVAVLGLYYLAFAYVRHSDGISLSTLVRIEERLDQARELVAPFKVNHIAMFVVLFALYLAVMVGMSNAARQRLHKGVNIYKNAVRLVYIVIVLLVSFTFLGTLPGNPQLDVELKIKTVREGYDTLREEVASTLVEQAAEQLCQKAYDSFLPWYGETFDLPLRVAGEAAALSASYSRAVAEHQVKDREIEAIIAKYSRSPQAAMPSGRATPISPTVHTTRISPEPRPVPGNASLAKIDHARDSLKQYRAGLKAQLTTFLQRPGAKEVVLQTPKLLTGQTKDALIALSSDFPLMEPLIDSLVKAVDDTVAKRLERAVDRATEATVAGNLKAVSQQVSEFARETPVVVSQQTQEKARTAKANLENSLVEVVRSKTRLETAVRQVETRRIDTWIERLTSTDSEVRREAATRLAQSGEKLSKPQINRLVQLMKDGQKSWTRFLYRESHCEWHEEVTVKHYAGEALAHMKSPYVDSKLAEEARTASNKGVRKYRVTDPGWI